MHIVTMAMVVIVANALENILKENQNKKRILRGNIMTTRKAEELEWELNQIIDYCGFSMEGRAMCRVCEILKEVIDALPKED